MHVMQVDMPATRGTEEHPENPQSRPPLSSLPLPLEKRTPSASSIDSWSRDLAFYSAPSRPQTPSSVRSSRPVSLPSSTALSSFPLAHINLPPAALAPFTTSPLTSPTHQTVPVSPPSGGSLPLPPSISISRRVSTPPEDLDALPLQLNFRFPKQERSVESEPESVDREAGRFARLRARTSSALQVRRSSASSSLRSKLQAAADAADRLASEDGSIAAPPPATAFPAATQGPVIVVESMAVLSSKKQAGGIPGSASKEQAVHQRTAGQLGDQVCGTESPAAHAPRGVHAFPLQNMDSVQPASHTQGAGNVRHVALRPEVKPEPEPEPALPPKKRSQSWGSHKAIGGRSTSTPLPLSRPLPSPPTVTTHPEPIIDSPPTPPPRAHGHGLTRGQNQYVPPAPSLTTHSVSPPTLHVAHVAPSTASHASLPAGAAAPSRVAHASTAPVVHTTHPLPPSQITHLSPSPPPPPPPPRTAQTATLPSRMGHASVSSVIQSTSSSSSHVDNMSTASAPQMRRRDASPSSSHGQHSPHTSERHGPYHHHPGHHHHPPHHHHGHPRSLSEPGPAGVLSSSQLAHAARLPVVRENGVRLQFGELWRTQRTVVIFIRHFWYARPPCFF
ncbi:hypothetical protein B0F90DRAFT_858595 [Multifurca ochricompacta]|uniref:Uncharacterized protein n=1 Tax=Multifurca ochricompacta TaxID=376703 RepID=A0AAD4QIP1_9AGAM|nr:hypothetical protein B0F90DRAFT_858595 [Multifurca ochricompacta]